MADPHVENGHTDIANEIVDHFCRLRLSGREWNVVWVVIRKTWGWHKKEDRISVRQVAKMTKLDIRNSHRILQDLVDRRVLNRSVVKIGNASRINYGIQKDFEKWVYRSSNVVKNDNTLLSKPTTKVLSKSVTTKEKKETIQKKVNRPPAREPFWTEEKKRQFNVWAIELKERTGRFNVYEFLNAMKKKYRNEEIFEVIGYMSAHPPKDHWAYGVESLKGKEAEREKKGILTNLMKHIEETQRLREEDKEWLEKRSRD